MGLPFSVYGAFPLQYTSVAVSYTIASEEDAPYHGKSLTLKQGDALFLYTDGVTEAVNTDDALFGEEKLKNALNAERAETAGEICARAGAELSAYAQNSKKQTYGYSKKNIF